MARDRDRDRDGVRVIDRGGLGIGLAAEARRDGVDVGRDQRGGLLAQYGYDLLAHPGVRVGQHLVGC